MRIGSTLGGSMAACSPSARWWQAVLSLFLLAVIACGGPDAPGPSAAGEVPPGADVDAVDVVQSSARDEIILFFPGASGLLYPEPRRVTLPESPEQQAVLVLSEFLAGPRSDGLARPFEEDVRLGGVYLSALVGSGSVAIVDLISSESGHPPPSGSREERQRVYGVVHSALENIDSLTGVVLMWNGRQRPAFAGHVDTGHVLVRDPSLIAAVR